MPTQIVRVELDSRDRVSGARNDAYFNIPWNRVIRQSNVRGIKVLALYQTKGAYYQNTTHGGVALEFQNAANVVVDLHAGFECYPSGQNANRNALFTAARYDNEYYRFESTGPLLELDSHPNGLTRVTTFIAGSNELLHSHVDGSGNAASTGDMGEWILTLIFETEMYYSDDPSTRA